MVVAVVGLLVYVRFVVPLRLLHRPWMVDAVVGERGRSTTLRLRPVGHPGMRFLPGQFAWLTVGRSPFAIEDHPFSFSSSAEEQGTIAFTIKDAGDFTRSIATLEPGASAYVEGPHGAFSVDRYEGDGCVFVAGGVGITPIMSMLRTLADRKDPRPHLLVYGARTPDEFTFHEEIQDCAPASTCASWRWPRRLRQTGRVSAAGSTRPCWNAGCPRSGNATCTSSAARRR